MAGVLSTIPQGVLMDPKAAAIMQAGLGMMAASGPSRTPVSLGQAFGQAGQQGLQAFAQANQANQQQQMFALKMQEVEREAEQRRQQQASIDALASRPEFAQYADLLRLGQFGPVLDRVIPKPDSRQMIVGGPGSQIFQPGNPNPIATVPFRPEPPKPPQTRTYQVGDQRVTEEMQPDGTWKELGRGPAFAKQVPPVVVGGGGGARQAPVKPMPASALRMQQDDIDAITTASSISADLGEVERQLESGELKLGPVANLVAQGRNIAGASNENSRNFASFKATLEKLRNESLRLNKGVQTEGDSVRAWNELIANINDPQVVKERLGEIRRLNDRAVTIRSNNIATIRANYQQEPLDLTNFINQPSTLGRGTQQTQGAIAKPPPKPGDVVDGWRFKGGDPSSPFSWQKVN